MPVVLITFVIAGGLGVLATFLLLRAEAAQDDATVACGEVAQIGLPLEPDEVGLNEPLYWRLFGIGGFASAAGVGDDSHAALYEPAEQLFAGLSLGDVDVMEEALQELSTACGDIGR